MTTTDKLDDAALEYIAQGGSIYTMAHVKRMARELVERRRASQAAPAPVAYRVRLAGDDTEEWALMSPKDAVNYLQRTGYECQPLHKTAPAPSDGLREAAQTLLDGAETGSLAELHHAVSDLFGVVDGSDQENELFEALLEGLRHTGNRAAPTEGEA